jgi:hypothetical protein
LSRRDNAIVRHVPKARSIGKQSGGAQIDDFCHKVAGRWSLALVHSNRVTPRHIVRAWAAALSPTTKKNKVRAGRSILTATIGHNNCFVNVTDIAIRLLTLKEFFHEPVRIQPNVE